MKDEANIDRELARRLELLEDPINQGPGFGAVDWIWLAVLGAALPVVLMLWGWN